MSLADTEYALCKFTGKVTAHSRGARVARRFLHEHHSLAVGREAAESSHRFKTTCDVHTACCRDFLPVFVSLKMHLLHLPSLHNITYRKNIFFFSNSPQFCYMIVSDIIITHNL